jgi:hypothetical protein
MALILDGNGLIQGLDAGGLPSGSVNADTLASTLDLSSKTMTFGNVSASGITFPATQSASSNANTLDDYEEGTFTAGATIGSGSVTVAFTAVCRYIKIGNQVHVIGRPNLNGSGSGALRITGLPFTSIGAPSGGSGEQALLIIMALSTGNANQFIGTIGASSTTISIVYTAGTNLADTAGAYIDSDTDVYFGFTYIAA